MGLTREDKILKQITTNNKFEPKAEIATGMFIPNKSGANPKQRFYNNGTFGNGLNIDMRYAQSVKDNDSVSLIYINAENQNTNSCQLYPIKIDVDTDRVDTGAGLCITNIGMSDCIYLAVKGKAVGASAPTGIGIDLNKDDYADSNGYGLQVWDFSSTDHGSNPSPCAIYLKKHINVDTNHKLMKLQGDNKLLAFVVEDTTKTNVIIEVEKESDGSNVFDIKANGAVSASSYAVGASAGASGTFTSADGKTIIVTNGIITSIV